MNDPLLQVEQLRIAYGRCRSAVEAVHGVDLRVGRGEVLAVVGESGSGKSTIAQAIVRMLPDTATQRGRIVFDGTDLQRVPRAAMRGIRGGRIGFVPQDPSHSLNPLMRVGEQIAESLRRHRGLTRAQATARAVEILGEVGIPDPDRRARQYPHELSGGLRQRVLIGIAWSCDPDLVIADEPTSALDATVQRHVLDRMESLRHSHGTSVLLVTHDLAVAADRADRIVVVEKGVIVEQGDARTVLSRPEHEYTRRLVAAAPGLHPTRLQPSHERSTGRQDGATLLRVESLSKTFRGGIAALADVSLVVPRGSTVALVGESGSGKSTTARMIARIVEADAGRIHFDGADITHLRGEQLRQLRRRIQVVYQNPFGSLDPRMRVGALIAEPLRAFRLAGGRAELAKTVMTLMEQVRLDASLIDRTPAQLSGGQRQRVAIARTLTLQPELLILDEPVSALDVSVQRQVLQLLVDLQAERDLTYLFISHDLGVVRQISDTVAVMRGGRWSKPARRRRCSRRHRTSTRANSSAPSQGVRTRERRGRQAMSLDTVADVVIVGSGIMGAAVAALVREAEPRARIVMVDVGEPIGSRPGVHLHEVEDPAIWERYNATIVSGIQGLYVGDEKLRPLVKRGEDLEPGMHRLATLGEDADDFPGAALSWNAGGMGVHWTAATPAPGRHERFGDEARWPDDLAIARRLLRVEDSPLGPTEAGSRILDALRERFPDVPPDRAPQPMPMAVRTRDGRRERTGPADIFPPIAGAEDPAFTLMTGTIARSLEVKPDGTVTGVRVVRLADGDNGLIAAAATIVCADALRTPQLLFASGIRPPALGC